MQELVRPRNTLCDYFIHELLFIHKFIFALKIIQIPWMTMH